MMALEGDPLAAAAAAAGATEGGRDPRIALDLKGALAILEKANVLAILVECLPPAATNGRGEVTAESVIMPPPTLTASLKESKTQIGNVLKCFIHILDQVGDNTSDANTSQTIDTYLTIYSQYLLFRAMFTPPPPRALILVENHSLQITNN